MIFNFNTHDHEWSEQVVRNRRFIYRTWFQVHRYSYRILQIYAKKKPLTHFELLQTVVNSSIITANILVYCHTKENLTISSLNKNIFYMTYKIIWKMNKQPKELNVSFLLISIWVLGQKAFCIKTSRFALFYFIILRYSYPWGRFLLCTFLYTHTIVKYHNCNLFPILNFKKKFRVKLWRSTTASTLAKTFSTNTVYRFTSTLFWAFMYRYFRYFVIRLMTKS